MSLKRRVRMGKWNRIFVMSAVLLPTVFLSTNLFSAQIDTGTQALISSNSQSAIQNLSSVSSGDPKSAFPNPQLENAEVIQNTTKLQIPFISNEGQTDERVKFYANTFGETVFVTKDGEIVYALPNNSSELGVRSLESGSRRQRPEARRLMPEIGIQECRGEWHSPRGVSPLKRGVEGVSECRGEKEKRETCGRTSVPLVNKRHCEEQSGKTISNSKIQNMSSTVIENPKSKITGIAFKETLVGAKIGDITGELPSVTNVNYFKGKDPSKWKTNISTYETVSLGEVYDGIELKLKAYGNNVEKLFCVKPGANPAQIKIRLSGINPQKFPLNKGGWRGLSVNEHGELELETALGSVKFTKPVAYQEIEGKRLISGGENGKFLTSNLRPPIRNQQSEVPNLSPATRHSFHSGYGFTVASYDKTKELIIDPLLASKYLGGSYNDYGYSLAVDTDGNVYVTGNTHSKDFPTTSGAYDTSFIGGNDGDTFVSKLNGSLTNLLTSTFLGRNYGYSLAIDTSGNVYVMGYHNVAYSNPVYDVFVLKLDSNLSASIPTPTPSSATVSSPILLSILSPTPTPSQSPTPILTPTTEPTEKGIISGFVIYKKDNLIESTKIRLKGANTKVFLNTTSDEDGLFEFADLDADTYIITAIKKGYKRVKQTVTLEAGEEKDIEILMRKKIKRIQHNP